MTTYNKQTVKDINLTGKRIIMRVDFNVPVKEGVIQNDTRIKAALPTINYILAQNPKSLVLMSHLGDPKKDTKKAQEKADKEGKAFDAVKFSEGKHRMKPVAAQLAKLLGKEVKLAPSCLGAEVKTMVNALSNGEILMLENTRYHKEETSKEATEREAMAKELATYGEIYVNDAFGTAHRAHASTETIAHYLPAVAGLLIEKELKYLGEAMDNPARPFVAIIGGAKVSSKITVLKNLIGKVETLIIGGGMAYTFYKAMGKETGKSLLEPEFVGEAKAIMDAAKNSKTNIVLPVDVMIADDFSETANTNVVDVDHIPSDWEGLDIGPKTIEQFSAIVKAAKTVIWNGPMGVFEMKKFAVGTNAIVKILADTPGIVSIIGGGDSASAAEKSGFGDKITHISTGGGASLEFLEGKVLPGIAALQDK